MVRRTVSATSRMRLFSSSLTSFGPTTVTNEGASDSAMRCSSV